MDEESLASPEVLTSLSQALSNLVLGDNEIRAEYGFSFAPVTIFVTPIYRRASQRGTPSHRKMARNPARTGYSSPSTACKTGAR